MIEDQEVYYASTGNGVTAEFAYGCRIFKPADLVVKVSGVTKALAVDYSISGVDNPAGGAVTFLPGHIPAAGELVERERVLEYSRQTGYAENGDFRPETVDRDQDYQTALLQQTAATFAAQIRQFALDGQFIKTSVSASLFGPDLSAAILALGSSHVTLVVDSPITANLDAILNANTALSIPKPGSLIVAAGKTVTINGPFSATGEALTGPGNLVFNTNADFSSATINTSGNITFNKDFSAGMDRVFTGSGIVSGLKRSRPEWFATNATPGTTDMTTAITKAIASIGNTFYGIVELRSHYLISANISVPAGITVIGLSSSGTRIYKSAAMTTTGVTLAGFNSQLESLAVMTDLGATGDGIRIENANVVLRNVVVHGAVKTTPSGNGIRIGVDVGPSNCNNWLLDNVRVTGMSGHGVYVHDKPGFEPDANSGTALHVEAEDNAGDGIKEDNGWLNTYIGCLSQGNVNGIQFAAGSKFSSVVGGDYEANTVDVLINVAASQATISGIPVGTIITDNSTTTRRLERQIQKMGTWTPVLAGDAVAGAQTYSVQAGWYHRHGDLVTVQGRIGLSAKDAATAGNMRITGLPFACATITNGFFPVAFSSWGAFTFPANFTAIGGNVGSAVSYITLNRNGSAQTATAIAASEIGAAAVVIFSVTYPVAVF